MVLCFMSNPLCLVRYISLRIQPKVSWLKGLKRTRLPIPFYLKQWPVDTMRRLEPITVAGQRKLFTSLPLKVESCEFFFLFITKHD